MRFRARMLHRPWIMPRSQVNPYFLPSGRCQPTTEDRLFQSQNGKLPTQDLPLSIDPRASHRPRQASAPLFCDVPRLPRRRRTFEI